ncbi:NB-ARC domain-containing disease resistance protein, partial [Melia azedarach]
MADAIVSAVLQQLTSLMAQEMQEEVRLVVGVEKEVDVLAKNLRTMRAVLVDAEQRQVKEESIRLWLDQLKDASYDMEDVLDEWNTARLKLQIE